MAEPTHTAANVSAAPDVAKQYVVVARRYRPQGFAELVGQEHVAQALSNAIETNRVGHAYLFTGARGVGKTSSARILAKALNCEKGSTAAPCNECDVCKSVSGGDDVDVLEIDGASNRGIDEIRQLRQNVNVRPSRSRYKIYIIDEVHMLTREAFNALLKTLEEPPEHVKFIFCTTEPNKIPITILSRCQRFDFAGIATASIAARLRQIVDAEGVEAEPEALELLARRAAGSMRDSQSLLEQLLAFAPGKISVADVHGMLGTANDAIVFELVRNLSERNAPEALRVFDAALQAGVDASQLFEQLLGSYRDCMVASVGCPPEGMIYVSPGQADELRAISQRLGLHTILASLQIIDQTMARFRVSTQSRILAELALVRICQLEDLDEIAGWIAELQNAPAGSVAVPGIAAGAPSPRIAPPAAPSSAYPTAPSYGPPVKKNFESTVNAANDELASADANDDALPPDELLNVAAASAAPESNAPAVSLDNPTQAWSSSLTLVSGLVVDQAKQFSKVTFSPPNRLSVFFEAKFFIAKAACEKNVAKFERALADATGKNIKIDFQLEASKVTQQQTAAPTRAVSQHQLMLEISKNPMVQRATELFGATPTNIEQPDK